MASQLITTGLKQKQYFKSSMNNPKSHLRNVKELQGIINAYQSKLDDQINDVFEKILNQSHNINEHPKAFPIIENKRIGNNSKVSNHSFGQSASRRVRAQSTGNQSFSHASVINQMSYSQEFHQVDEILRSLKGKQGPAKKDEEWKNRKLQNIAGRAIGAQKYGKPKFVKRKPQILSKEMRWDPFCEKNAIKAQELDQGMMSLIERGKVGKNIDIITAFEKGGPVLEANQAIFHHMEEKFAESDIQQQISRLSRKKKESHRNPENEEPRNRLIPEEILPSESPNQGMSKRVSKGDGYEGAHWSLTMPDDIFTRDLSLKGRVLCEEDLFQTFYIEFLHYKLVANSDYKNMKRSAPFNQIWGQVQELLQQIERALRKYTIQIAYVNSNKVLQLAKLNFSLRKVHLSQIYECLAKSSKNSKQEGPVFSITSVKNPSLKKDMAVSLIYPFFKMAEIRKKYMAILKRKMVEKKMGEWIRNGRIIKQYRSELQAHKHETLGKFEQLQRKFKLEYPSIQSNKHYEIHVPNFNFMANFKYFPEFCATEITRIFNLENSNTHIIYVCPFELSVDTINYYFKIMELEEIELYNDRVTFLELEDLKLTDYALPKNLNTSSRLFYNSKALRKLMRKIQSVPAYFVTSYPSEVDINLAVHLSIPILSGNFIKINPLRSALNSNTLMTESLPAMAALRIQPRQANVFQISNMLIRYCESNKKHRKYVVKINKKSNSSGLALLQYPFSSLPEMYTSTSLVQSHYYHSIQKFYSDLAMHGGVVQFYLESIKTITVSLKILHDESYIINGTFEKISNGFVNIGYLFPQKCIPHRLIVDKCKPLMHKLIENGHIGYVELTLLVDSDDNIFLEEVELFSTRITNSLSYFKFLEGGYFNSMGEFMTKIAVDDEELESAADESIATLEPRGYCYIPFMLHFGLSQKQTSTFFQLCRIAGISFDLQNKYGTTFVLLGSLKDTIGIMTTAKDRKSILKLLSKSAEFLIKQNSHNMSTEMLKEKQLRMKERLNIVVVKERFDDIS